MESFRGLSCEDISVLSNRFTLPQQERCPNALKRKKIIVLSGPTAVGKTQLSLTIAKAIGGEIVSSDSMQVYRGMDIGTAKVGVQERLQVPHHLIDSIDLDETFNAMEFYKQACQSIKEIFSKEGVPVVVGGTGFYIHSLIYGPPSGPPSEPALRQQLESEMEKRGAEALYEWLIEKDPLYAATITCRDRHKIIRALEIIMITRQRVSDLPRPETDELDLSSFRCWFIHMPKEVLYPRIEKRCDQMIEQGFLEEVKRLEKEGLAQNTTASQAIGYRQALDYLRSSKTPADWDQFVAAFKQASRRYAKRQFTWFRREPLFRWIDISKISFDSTAEMIIQDYELNF